MTGPEREQELEPSVELRQWLDQLRAEPARPAFEARLRREFLEQAAQEAAPALRPVPQRTWSWGPVAALAAVAAAIALFLFRPTPEGLRWQVVDPRAGATVMIDGSPHDQSDAAAVAAALKRARTVRTDDQPFTARLGDAFAVHLDEHSAFQFVTPPSYSEAEDEGVGSVRLAVMDLGSSLSVATGPDFPGSDLVVETPDADVRVVGTAFAIHLLDESTCVCCTHGEVSVSPRDPGAPPCGRVPGGKSGIFADGVDVFSGDMMPEHISGLEQLRSTCGWR